ncbi:TRAP transporter small permease [Clostridium formicaceticum]|uniref:2,3-diketo-L-gulonate TRAP transporter small permease protein YiaM n=1 Tax=Clostridium formicaceticum TaxID=1497 RepID=A0AAC9WGU3_9CLOT|nr:TRAP transporter small permease [Clostridium formicaceticum]AOY77646.1 C4-dicarboxylate ABC transporter permease [Clostridium formicaceticum]ARE88231.1 2,3-diketo-L-gulonate TRAP transporter small permease protein YiaM [Clostridium formicaceticum]
MQTIRKFVDKIIELICITFVGAMTALVTWQVVTRYFFKNPSVITEQLSKYMFVWLVLLASSYVFGKREHMSIVFIKEKFTGSTGLVVDIIIELIIIAFALGILVLGGYKNVLLTMTQQDSVLPIKIGVLYGMLPVCGVLTTFYSLCNIIDIAKGFFKKEALKSKTT